MKRAAGEDPFVGKVEAALKELAPALQSPGQTVLVAFSGGPDSSALLFALDAVVGKGSHFRIAAHHVNHGLRGAESDAEEEHCARLCRSMGIPFAARKVIVQSKDEASLRDARYASLLDEAQKLKALWIATGHTLNDQAETLLFRLFRGTAARGLLGIPGRRILSGETTVLRPLLGLERPEILAFLERCQLPFCSDSSNNLPLYARNYVRLHVMPQIEERFPGAIKAIERCRQSLTDDQQALSWLAQKSKQESAVADDSFAVAQLATQPHGLLQRIIAECLEERQVEVTQERLHAMARLLHDGRGRLSLNAEWDAQVSNDRLRFINKGLAEESLSVASFAVQAQVPGLTHIPEHNLCLQIEPAGKDMESKFPKANADQAFVDLSRTVPPLVVRSRRQGDRIRPFGMDEPVGLKKYLHTHKSRSQINPLAAVVLADAQEILWVPGVGISEVVRVKRIASHTSRVLTILDEG